jgi:cell wall-active antibiotic response 4TMS protein YvqF/B-box zinc finger protein
MNCANHADASAVAYCRTCGKPLCGNCTRPVRGVIYCEECLGAKMEGVPGGASSGASAGTPGFVSGSLSPAPFFPATSGQIPPMPPPSGSSGPNPTVAGILGAFPGVGAVYTGQYVKGLVHLAIFVLLVIGANASDDAHSEALGVICGFGIAFFIVYQIIDSVRTAKAIQMAQPVPDPFGLAATFGGGAKIETSKIPMGAIFLILLGVLFLLHTMGVGLGLDRFWPLILIFVGGWMLARNWGLAGSYCTGCQCARCRTRRLMGPAMVLTVGVLLLLQSLHVAGFGRTWPVILLAVGVIKLLQGSASLEGHIPSVALGPNAPGGPIPPTPPAPPVPPVPPVPPSEVNRG